jgi:hypothetical protein
MVGSGFPRPKPPERQATDTRHVLPRKNAGMTLCRPTHRIRETFFPEQGVDPAGRNSHPPAGSGFWQRAFVRAMSLIMPHPVHRAIHSGRENPTTTGLVGHSLRFVRSGNPL